MRLTIGIGEIADNRPFQIDAEQLDAAKFFSVVCKALNELYNILLKAIINRETVHQQRNNS